MLEKNFIKFLTLNVLTSGHCMIAQMSLTVLLSYIWGNSLFVFTLFTGLYLMAMGLGVLLVEKFEMTGETWIKVIILNSLAGVFLANPGIIGLLFLNETFYYWLREFRVDVLFLLFPIGMVLSVMLGIVAGAEMPIFSKIFESEKMPTSNPIIRVLASDYLGAALGIFIFAFILFPFTGLIHTILFSQLITILFIDFMIIALSIFKKNFYSIICLGVLNIYIWVAYINRDVFLKFISILSGI